MTTKLTPILEIAKEILKPAGLKGMHVDDMAAVAADANKTMSLNAEDFSRKLQAALASNLKLKIQKPSFVRVEGKKKGQYRKGWYRLKVDRTAERVNDFATPRSINLVCGVVVR